MTRGSNAAKENAIKLLEAIETENLEQIENIDEKWKKIGRTKLK